MKPTLKSLRSTWKTPTVDALPNPGVETLLVLLKPRPAHKTIVSLSPPHPFTEADFDVFGDFTIGPDVGFELFNSRYPNTQT